MSAPTANSPTANSVALAQSGQPMTYGYACVYDRQGYVLLFDKPFVSYFYRSKTPHGIYPLGCLIKHGGGKKAFPGGALDGAITVKDGALREWREETGTELVDRPGPTAAGQFAVFSSVEARFWDTSPRTKVRGFGVQYFCVQDVGVISTHFTGTVLPAVNRAITDVQRRGPVTIPAPLDNELMGCSKLHLTADKALLDGLAGDGETRWFHAAVKHLRTTVFGGPVPPPSSSTGTAAGPPPGQPPARSAPQARQAQQPPQPPAGSTGKRPANSQPAGGPPPKRQK